MGVRPQLLEETRASAPGTTRSRPAVSVVMPFAGDEHAAARALEALCAIEFGPGDELLVADNTPGLTLSAVAERWPQVRVLAASAQRSSYYARNVAAAAAGNDWLLFIDSDCVPEPGILDRYFEATIDEREGAIAGEILPDDSQTHVIARYQRDREYLNQRRHVEDPVRPHAVTANVLVREAAWRSVGGFLEGVRSGADTEFAWRLQQAGWRLGYRRSARVVHCHRETWRGFVRQIARYAAGRGWLNRRHPGSRPAEPHILPALRALAATAFWALRGERERARFRALDALVNVLDAVCRQLRNSPAQPSRPAAPARIVVLVDTFPEVSETFVAAEVRGLARAGWPARIEAARRAERQDVATARELDIDYREDDTAAEKLRSLAWVLTRHPRACANDLLARKRWRREEHVPPLRVIAPVARRIARHGEHHLHAHFAAGAALTALRVARLVGRRYSVTAHAYDIFREPRNLREKLESAAFVTTGCAYNVEHLRRLAPRAEVHEIVMGVDAQRFARRSPYPGGAKVIAVGRLVEKKGFAHLIDAVAMLEPSAPIDALEIVGDGPLAGELQARAQSLGIAGKVRFRGALDHEAVRSAIESADLLAMPCVVASDGDRDSMPVVVKEALALELPVVGSDEVGLPELIHREWGRLVPPADPAALAGAIAELLALPPEERAAMGRAGREWVLAHCNSLVEGARLGELLARMSDC